LLAGFWGGQRAGAAHVSIACKPLGAFKKDKKSQESQIRKGRWCKLRLSAVAFLAHCVSGSKPAIMIDTTSSQSTAQDFLAVALVDFVTTFNGNRAVSPYFADSGCVHALHVLE
jgi:hypothetical protein